MNTAGLVQFGRAGERWRTEVATIRHYRTGAASSTESARAVTCAMATTLPRR